MNLRIKRVYRTKENTLGLLFVDGVFECFTLEDLPHEPKIWGKTRIPEGTYRIDLRKIGRLHEKYSKRFPDFHKGMLWLRNVPNFEYIYIHIGNDAEDTDGCILVGYRPNSNLKRLVSSTVAYTKLYAKCVHEEELTITIEDEG